MTLEHFMNEAISSWMRKEGPESDIVLSTRIRLARNLANEPFPITASGKKLQEINDIFYERYNHSSIENYANLEFININQLSHIEKRVLVEKHLISPFLAKSKAAAVLISENEQASIMINEEDHIRIQLYFSGLQLKKALDEAFLIDDWLEETIDYAFDEEKGYLTSCPTNTGTGLRASVMVHLPALVYTKQISRMLPAINQLGFVVRGIYGEGSEARGSIFQISNQITLGKSEQDICKDLEGIITQLVGQERLARQNLLKQSQISLENEVFRSYGLLKYSRIMESSEAMNRLSHLRLGIDLGIITDISHNVLNELIVLIQPGFLQYYAKGNLTAHERDILRASLIRERLQIEV